jgi:hypothetical protein
LEKDILVKVKAWLLPAGSIASALLLYNHNYDKKLENV